MPKFLSVIVIFAGILFPVSARPQSSPGACPLVKAKNAQEATMMEAASDKTGCWSRNKDGNLVFLSSASPSKNYKPLVGDTKGRCPKLPIATSTASSLASRAVGKRDPIVGKWHVTCCSFLGGTGFGNFTPHAADGTLSDGGKGTLEIDALHRVRWYCERIIFTHCDACGPSRTIGCNDPDADERRGAPWEIGKNDTLSEASPGTYVLKTGEKDGPTWVVQATLGGDMIRGQVCYEFGDDVSTSTRAFFGSRAQN